MKIPKSGQPPVIHTVITHDRSGTGQSEVDTEAHFSPETVGERKLRYEVDVENAGYERVDADTASHFHSPGMMVGRQTLPVRGRATQHRPSPVSRPPEPIPVERPSRVPLNKILHGSPAPPQEANDPTAQSTRKISSWLRLQLEELRHTAESVFADTDDQLHLSEKTDTIERAVWQLKDTPQALQTPHPLQALQPPLQVSPLQAPQTPMPADIPTPSREVDDDEDNELPELNLPTDEYAS